MSAAIRAATGQFARGEGRPVAAVAVEPAVEVLELERHRDARLRQLDGVGGAAELADLDGAVGDRWRCPTSWGCRRPASRRCCRRGRGSGAGPTRNASRALGQLGAAFEVAAGVGELDGQARGGRRRAAARSQPSAPSSTASSRRSRCRRAAPAPRATTVSRPVGAGPGVEGLLDGVRRRRGLGGRARRPPRSCPGRRRSASPMTGTTERARRIGLVRARSAAASRRSAARSATAASPPSSSTVARSMSESSARPAYRSRADAQELDGRGRRATTRATAAPNSSQRLRRRREGGAEVEHRTATAHPPCGGRAVDGTSAGAERRSVSRSGGRRAGGRRARP